MKNLNISFSYIKYNSFKEIIEKHVFYFIKTYILQWETYMFNFHLSNTTLFKYIIEKHVFYNKKNTCSLEWKTWMLYFQM